MYVCVKFMYWDYGDIINGTKHTVPHGMHTCHEGTNTGTTHMSCNVVCIRRYAYCRMPSTEVMYASLHHY